MNLEQKEKDNDGNNKEEFFLSEEPKLPNINHPEYYTKGRIETWDFIKDKGLNFDRGNAVKYIVRAGDKDPKKEIEDLKKAINYINHEIKHISKRKEVLYMVDEKLVDYILSRVNELENKVETLKGVVIELEYQVNSK